ncbi:MAG: hypothetical protein RIT27_395 [Pseudomonadota bacterium]
MSINPNQKLDKGIIQALWLSHEELLKQSSKIRSPLVLRNIDDYLKGIRYPLDFIQDVE